MSTKKNKLNDGWRGNFISQQISEPGHPLTKFGTGNKDTLSGDNRPALQIGRASCRERV